MTQPPDTPAEEQKMLKSVIVAAALGLAAGLPAHAASCDMETMSSVEFGQCMMGNITRLPADGTPKYVSVHDIDKRYGCVTSNESHAQVFMPDVSQMLRHGGAGAFVRCHNGRLEVKWLDVGTWK